MFGTVPPRWEVAAPGGAPRPGSLGRQVQALAGPRPWEGEPRPEWTSWPSATVGLRHWETESNCRAGMRTQVSATPLSCKQSLNYVKCSPLEYQVLLLAVISSNTGRFLVLSINNQHGKIMKNSNLLPLLIAGSLSQSSSISQVFLQQDVTQCSGFWIGLPYFLQNNCQQRMMPTSYLSS